MTNPLVSILIPAHNAAPWLPATLRSALAQTWNNIEIIVVDDGSSDGSLQTARSFESDRLRVISQSNSGASSARNAALREARGDYIQYLDADDLISPRKLESQLELLGSNPAGYLGVCGTVYFHDGQQPENGEVVEGWPMIDSDSPVEWLISLYGGNDDKGSMVHPGAWLVPRSVAEAAGPWMEERSRLDDGEYFCRVVLASKGIRCAKGVFSYYRKHTVRFSSLSGSRSESVLLGSMHSLDRMTQQLLARTKDERARHGMARSYLEMAIASYPYCPKAANYGVSRARELDPNYRMPSLGGLSEVARRLFGWKAARWLSALRSRLGS